MAPVRALSATSQTALRSRCCHPEGAGARRGCERRRTGGAHPDRHSEMPLFIISIPLMVLGACVAVIPLIVISHREHQRNTTATTAPDSAAELGASTVGQAEVPVAG